MSNVFHFLHDADKSCYKYDNYLKNARTGKWFIFNWQFAIFQGFFFIVHKMYRECALYGFLLGLSFGMLKTFPIVSLSLLFFTYIFFCFSSYKLYELRNNRLMKKVNFRPNLFLQQLKSQHFIIASFMVFINIISFLYSWILASLLLNSLLYYINLVPESQYLMKYFDTQVLSKVKQ